MIDDPRAHDLEQFRARQKSRNKVLGLILGALAVLFFAISIAKIGMQSHRNAEATAAAGTGNH